MLTCYGRLSINGLDISSVPQILLNSTRNDLMMLKNELMVLHTNAKLKVKADKLLDIIDEEISLIDNSIRYQGICLLVTYTLNL